MGVITRSNKTGGLTTLQDGFLAPAADVDDDMVTIFNEINGNIVGGASGNNIASETVESANIKNDTIVDEDINSAAAIARTKIANPFTTRGDIIQANATFQEVRLALGTTGQVLTSDGTDAGWANNAALSLGISEASANTVPLPRGYLGGIQLTSTAASTTLTFAAGECRDTGLAGNIVLGAFTKTIAGGGWVAGTGNEGLEAAAAIDTWYHVFALSKTDGTADVGFDTDVDATNLLAAATDYTLYRRVGSILTDGSGDIEVFEQFGDTFLWNTAPAPEIRTDSGGTGTDAHLFDIVVPPDLKVEWIGTAHYDDTVGTKGLYLSSPDVVNQAPEEALTPMHSVSPTGNSFANAGMTHRALFTNTSQQIRTRKATTAKEVILQSLGWIDRRGRDD